MPHTTHISIQNNQVKILTISEKFDEFVVMLQYRKKKKKKRGWVYLIWQNKNTFSGTAQSWMLVLTKLWTMNFTLDLLWPTIDCSWYGYSCYLWRFWMCPWRLVSVTSAAVNIADVGGSTVSVELFFKNGGTVECMSAGQEVQSFHKCRSLHILSNSSEIDALKYTLLWEWNWAKWHQFGFFFYVFQGK